MHSIGKPSALAAPSITAPTGRHALPSRALLLVLGAATGALAANLYYAQPLLALIGPDLDVRPDLAGAFVSVTQIGYAVGLFFLVSLADLVESKRLVLLAISVTMVALLAAAVAPSAQVFLGASFVIGVGSTGAQVLIPFVAHMVPEAKRGQAVGNVMAGLLTGILLARPAALFVAGVLGWRSVFVLSAGLMVVIGALLGVLMPRFRPSGGMSYFRILASMAGLVRQFPVLRRRALYQGLMFMAFNLFWTAAPLMLFERFGLDPKGIALFALAGAGGALAAPIAGRFADLGWVRGATLGAMIAITLAFLATGWVAEAGLLAGLVVLTVVIDASVQVNQIVSQRVIFSLAAEVRGRVNAIYMTIAFLCGSIGSILATLVYNGGGWTATAFAGGAIGIVALAAFARDWRHA